MSFQLPRLPYELDAFEPHLSARALKIHHVQHHKAYVDSLNQIIDGTPYVTQSLEKIIRDANASQDRDLFNNAAQTWNHEFLWQSMSPDGGGDPEGKLARMITDRYGDLDGFRDVFRDAAATEFGSGWVWLVQDNGSVDVQSTTDAYNPVVHDVRPLLTLDVWEHAYYLDFQNDRARYVSAFLEHFINWDFAAENLEFNPRIGVKMDELHSDRTASGAA